ncbi:MAG: type II toxin-antitoxin system VapB family antitoxin [Curvibacter sp.]|nr:MAG: type II toxin-antitoxin system VapB family antitoxin [Curvibacter sp.]
MRTNIDINGELLARAMEAGGFKTKKEAVEEGLRLLARKKIYDGLLALQGQLHWDDSDEGWAQASAQMTSQQGPAMAVAETPAPAYKTAPSVARPVKRRHP